MHQDNFPEDKYCPERLEGQWNETEDIEDGVFENDRASTSFMILVFYE